MKPKKNFWNFMMLQRTKWEKQFKIGYFFYAKSLRILHKHLRLKVNVRASNKFDRMVRQRETKRGCAVKVLKNQGFTEIYAM